MSKSKKESFTLPIEALVAALVCSKDCTRVPLECLHIRGDGTIEATDGHILVQVEPIAPPSKKRSKTILIHRDDVKQILKMAGKIAPTITEWSDETIKVCTHNQSMTITPVLHAYPDINKVLQKKKDGKSFVIAVDLLIQLAEVLKKLPKDSYRPIPVKLTLHDSEDMKAMSFEVQNREQSHKVSGLIMPCTERNQ